MMSKVKEMKKIVAYNYERKLIEAPDYYTKADIKRKTFKYLKRHFKPLHKRLRP